MIQRKYSVEEIEALRRLCEDRYLFGDQPHREGPGITRMSRPYNESEMRVVVEEMVRTYILAGITAQMIRDENKRRWEDKP